MSQAPKRRAVRTTKKTSAKTQSAEKARPSAAEIREGLADKQRVFVAAKLFGMETRELIAELAELGMKKVAQSSLTREEAEQLLEQIELKQRVEKNVENEINQIQEKVDRELKAQAEPEAEADESDEEEKLRYRVEKNVENEIHQIQEKVERDISERLDSGMLIDASTAEDYDFSEEQEDEPSDLGAGLNEDFVQAVEDEADAELLEDVVPEITPAPEDSGFVAPLFVAPEFQAPNYQETSESEGAQDIEREDEEEQAEKSRPRRRGRRGTNRGRGPAEEQPELIDEPKAIKGSTRLEAQRRRRVEMREESRKKRHVVSEAEFLARRESVKRTMVVRERERTDHPGVVTQVGVLEDDMLVEHFVTSDTQASMVGNIYLGRVQNVLPSMEAAFIDIGKGRNGVLYAGEVNWRQAGLGGRNRKIEQALKSGDQVLVQVSKDPIGHKGARLTTQISLAGRYLVYVPGGRSAGISRKLPAPERKRLKEILHRVVPGDGGVIIRTAAEGVSEEAIAADVGRLHTLWEQISERTEKEKSSKGAKPVTMYEEPNMLVKVVRDLFNEDFSELIVDGKRAWNTVHAYICSVAPELSERLTRYNREEHEGKDAFEFYRVDEQIQKALSRKVWLPSGGTLVIDRTEAMTVIDVNTGKFTGAGGNLEETVTRNNLEAAEEIVRQMRLRDLGGMIVVDFIDMVLPENQDLVLRRLKETLGRDRTRHQISEVTSLGLVQMTRKRLGTGLLETFATECEHCDGRGVIIHEDPVEQQTGSYNESHGVRHQNPTRHPAAVAMQEHEQEEREKKPKKRSIEELAASVVVEDKPRRRRRSSSGVGSANTRGQAESVDQILETAEKAVRAADKADPEEPSGTQHLSYEEATEQYEKSPRRRRKVRGNSVSDVPPKREDFAPAKPQRDEEAKREDNAKREDPKRARSAGKRRKAEERTEQTVTVARSRGRRRAVRKTTQPEQHKQPRSAAKPQQAQPAAQPSESVSRGRGRRRAVRRSPQN